MTHTTLSSAAAETWITLDGPTPASVCITVNDAGVTVAVFGRVTPEDAYVEVSPIVEVSAARCDIERASADPWAEELERKASRARAALATYSPGEPDTHTGLTDLLADAMHLLGRDAVLGAVNTAELHYDEENGGAS